MHKIKNVFVLLSHGISGHGSSILHDWINKLITTKVMSEGYYLVCFAHTCVKLYCATQINMSNVSI